MEKTPFKDKEGNDLYIDDIVYCATTYNKDITKAKIIGTTPQNIRVETIGHRYKSNMLRSPSEVFKCLSHRDLGD